MAKDAYALRVNTIGEMVKIIHHFYRYPLIYQKHDYYLIWREIIMIMKRKEDITQEGLLTILSLRAYFNLGLSEALNTALPNIIPVIRPKVDNIAVPHGEWLAGFTSGL